MKSGLGIRVRRVYDAVSSEDGFRVLVDRVWPRGLRKDAAHLDEWAKDVAPSAELRVWYRHDPARFDEFRQRYTAELADPDRSAAVARLRARAAEGPLTLLTATKALNLSQAAVLAELLNPLCRTDRGACDVHKRLDPFGIKGVGVVTPLPAPSPWPAAGRHR